jgi:Flp pilus assembly protein TadB
MTLAGNRFSILDIIIIVVGMICLMALGMVIGIGPILVGGAILLVVIDSIYLLYYVRRRKTADVSNQR